MQPRHNQYQIPGHALEGAQRRGYWSKTRANLGAAGIVQGRIGWHSGR
jgi:hypothetical protein